MKKLLLSATFVFATMFATAQVLVVGTFDNDREEVIDKFTKNLGVGYQFSDRFVVGFVSEGDEFDIMGRLLVTEELYVGIQMPTENSTDDIDLSIGYALNVWNNLYIEPNYKMHLGDSHGHDDDGEFQIGFSFKF